MTARWPGAPLVAAMALVVGAAVGAAAAAVRSTIVPWRVGDLAAAVGDVPGTAPRAEVPETRHAFGTIGTGAAGRHRFEIRNVGGGPLTLTRGVSSCSCTVTDFDAAAGGAADGRMVVPAGGATAVTVKWTGKPPGGPFQQQVTVLTDDPRRPEIVFSIEGTVVPTWRAMPESIVLPKLAASVGGRASVTVFTYGDTPPVLGALTIDHPEADRLFALSSSPLAPAELAAEPSASGGFRIDLVAKPGLPLGPLRQTLRVAFTMGEDYVAEVPVEGTVGGDLVLAGGGWDSGRQALLLGTVSQKSGTRTRVWLTAKGPHREQVRPTIAETVPDGLEVTIGPGQPIGTGGVIRIPIDVVVPPGSRPFNHLCTEEGPPGRIVLQTGHPDSPTLTIPVCVAIGP